MAEKPKVKDEMSSIQDRINALKKSQGSGGDDKPKGPSPSSMPKVGGQTSKFGGGTPKCYICEKSVFKVEELKALDRVYHKSCFRCSGKVKNGCEKVLSLTDYVDRKGEDGAKEPYCRSCYNKLYAPKGMNSAAGMSMDNTVNKHSSDKADEAKKQEVVPPKAPLATAAKEKEEKKPVEAERRMSIQDRLAALKASQGSTSSIKPPVVKAAATGGTAAVLNRFGGGEKDKDKATEAASKPAPAPTEKPPKEEPPKEEPPKEEPPKEEPTKEEPLKEEPLKEEPPKEEPPKEVPPKEEPLKEEPLKEEPPKEVPPKEEPSKEVDKKPTPSVKPESSAEKKEESANGPVKERMTGRLSVGLAARMGSLDLSKVGMLGRPSSGSIGGGDGSSSGKESPPKAMTTSNVAQGDDGKVEVDNAMKRASLKKGGRKAPTKKKFVMNDDDD